MRLLTTSYRRQEPTWPRQGRHILAQFNETHLVVYQAYRASIANYAVRHQRFGGDFSFNRMSWIKPNFLWMMYRSGWGTKPDQERTLAITLTREGFRQILEAAVHSSYKPEVYPTFDDWKSRLSHSQVRLQWDPDHAPTGDKLDRRAIQLGLRGDYLQRFATEWIEHIEDISTFVEEQRRHVEVRRLDDLIMPSERVFPVPWPPIAAHLGINGEHGSDDSRDSQGLGGQ